MKIVSVPEKIGIIGIIGVVTLPLVIGASIVIGGVLQIGIFISRKLRDEKF